jgi:hypothetical protein
VYELSAFIKKKHIVNFVIFIIAFPVLINVLLLTWNTPITVGSPESWIGFFATYFGALFGGVISGAITFLGVLLTIRKQEKEKYLETFAAKLENLNDVKHIFYETERKLSEAETNIYKDGIDTFAVMKGTYDYFMPNLRELITTSAKVDYHFYEDVKYFVSETRKYIFEYISQGKHNSVFNLLKDEVNKMINLMDEHEARLNDEFFAKFTQDQQNQFKMK